MPSVRAQVIALGESEWKASRESADWRHWRGCQLVNPLCPDDLCVLPKDHVGTAQGYHILGTTAWDYPLKLTKKSVIFFSEEELDQEGLIRLGWSTQRELWPDA